MATKGKAISVKIATPKVIKALEEALVKLEKDYKAQEVEATKFEKAREAYQKELQDFAIANVKKATNFRTNYRSYSKTLNIDYDVMVEESKLPKEPIRDYIQIPDHEYREQKQEITNAIRILKMTDEEVVNTSTYNAVARYL